MPKGRKGGKNPPKKPRRIAKSSAPEHPTGRGRGRPAKIHAVISAADPPESSKKPAPAHAKKSKMLAKKRTSPVPPVKAIRDIPTSLEGTEAEMAVPHNLCEPAGTPKGLDGQLLVQFRESVRLANKELQTKIDELKENFSVSLAAFAECDKKVRSLDNRLAGIDESLRALSQTVLKNGDNLQRSMHSLKSLLDTTTILDKHSPPRFGVKIKKAKPLLAKELGLQASSPQHQHLLGKQGAKRGRRSGGANTMLTVEEHPNVYSSETKDPETDRAENIDNSEQRLEEAVKARIGIASEFNYDDRRTTESTSLMQGKNEDKLPKRGSRLVQADTNQSGNEEPSGGLDVTFGKKEALKELPAKSSPLNLASTNRSDMPIPSRLEATAFLQSEPAIATDDVLQVKMERSRELEFAETPATNKADQNRPLLHPITAQASHHSTTLFSRSSEKKDFF